VSGPCSYHAALSPLTQVYQVVDYYTRGGKTQQLRVEFAHDGWDVLLDHEARRLDGFGVFGLEPDEVGHELEVTARIRRAPLEALLG
jgi:hypothetical protein